MPRVERYGNICISFMQEFSSFAIIFHRFHSNYHHLLSFSIIFLRRLSPFSIIFFKIKIKRLELIYLQSHLAIFIEICLVTDILNVFNIFDCTRIQPNVSSMFKLKIMNLKYFQSNHYRIGQSTTFL